jgi:protein gp37
MSKSSIEWTDAVWNFVLGCTKCSPGCANCYAIGEVARERCEAHKGLATLKPVRNWTGLLRFVPTRLPEPLRRTKPTTWFVNSLSDFFHEDIPVDWQIAGLEVMRMADWHIFQLLTKREDQLRRLLNGDLNEYADLPNVMWGVSVEDRKFGLPRIEALRQTPAKIRWLSIEPLLEDLGEIDLDGIHWVVVGGESGLDARPMKEEWVWPIKQQCDDAGVPFFFKQWGGVNKKKTGRLLGGREYNESLLIEEVAR